MDPVWSNSPCHLRSSDCELDTVCSAVVYMQHAARYAAHRGRYGILSWTTPGPPGCVSVSPESALRIAFPRLYNGAVIPGFQLQ